MIPNETPQQRAQRLRAQRLREALSQPNSQVTEGFTKALQQYQRQVEQEQLRQQNPLRRPWEMPPAPADNTGVSIPYPRLDTVPHDTISPLSAENEKLWERRERLQGWIDKLPEPTRQPVQQIFGVNTDPNDTLGEVLGETMFWPARTAGRYLQGDKEGAKADVLMDAAAAIVPWGALARPFLHGAKGAVKDGIRAANVSAARGMSHLAGAEADALTRRGLPQGLKDDWAVLTPENPRGMPSDPAENAVRLDAAEEMLRDRGLNPQRIRGGYLDENTGEALEETSFLLEGLPPEEAAAIGELFGQNSVLTRQGLTDLTRGTTIPSRGRGETSPHGWFELPNGERISLDLNWDAPLPAPTPRMPWTGAGRPFAEQARRLSTKEGTGWTDGYTTVEYDVGADGPVRVMYKNPNEDGVLRIENIDTPALDEFRGNVGPAAMRRILRDLQESTGARRITAERVSGANPDRELSIDLVRQQAPTAGAMPYEPYRFDHYSQQEGLTSLDPNMAGTGRTGAEGRRTDRVPAQHVYPAGATPEPQFRGDHRYTGEVDANRLYDRDADTGGIREQMMKDFREGRAEEIGASELERRVKAAGFQGIRTPNATTLFEPTNISPYVAPRFADMSWDELSEYGARHGSPNLGKASPPVTIKDRHGRDVTINGGLEGTWTYRDIMELKALGLNPNDFDIETRRAIARKMGRTMDPTDPAKTDLTNFRGLLLGITSPNNPLTPNEFGVARLMPRSMDDIRKLAAMAPPPNATKEQRQAVGKKIREHYGLQAEKDGGLGVSGSADYTYLAELAKDFAENPEWFRHRPDEDWGHFAERVMNRVKGLGVKTSAFGIVWQNPSRANISAMDRHMGEMFWQHLFPTDAARHAEEARILADWNAGKRDMRLGRNGQPPPPRPKASTIDELRDLDGGAEFFVDDIMKLLDRKPTAVTRDAKTGAYNERVPEHLRNEEWGARGEPAKMQMMGDAYDRGVKHNAELAEEDDLGLFMSQWMHWDGKRGRLEPHEIMHPDLINLPPMPFDQVQDALNVHKDLGYLQQNRSGTGLEPVRPTNDARKLMYWSLLGGAGLGGLLSQPEVAAEEKPQGLLF